MEEPRHTPQNIAPYMHNITMAVKKVDQVPSVFAPCANISHANVATRKIHSEVNVNICGADRAIKATGGEYKGMTALEIEGEAYE